MTLEQMDPLKETAFREQGDAINPHTRLVGSIGWPAGPWSPLTLYNAAFDALGLNWRCVPLSVSLGRLREALLGLCALGFAGAELGEAYQREAIKHVDQLGPVAETVGSVNFVRVDAQGLLVGENSRWHGFLAALRTLTQSLNGLRPLVIGAGDAARSVVYALTREGLPVTVVAEQIDKAIDLVHRLRHAMDEHSFSVYRWPQDLERVARGTNLIVNATTVGAWPDVGRSPWPDDVPFPPGALAVDLVSWPSETRFLRQARASGARAIGGLSSLICGMAMAFEEWTGHRAPIEDMWGMTGGGLIPDVPSLNNVSLPKPT